MTPHELARREKMSKLAALGLDPWGQRFDDHTAIGEIRNRIGEAIYRTETGEELTPPNDVEAFKEWKKTAPKGDMAGPKVRAAGRIVLQRGQGKLRFLDIRDWSGRVQLLIGRNQVGEESWNIAECLDLGDIVGVDGELKRTNLGEVTIFVEKLTFLTKSIETPPEKFHGLVDAEMKQRMRYLDLAYNDDTMIRFLNRTKIVHSIRQTLANNKFVEVEGPTLHTIAGGAAARPFITHHNTLDMQLYMRIALELHLKRLLVGGIERVYELGRVYRNEGVSPRHNPEFTMLEAYQAYGDYRAMMDLCESIIVDAIKATGQPFKLQWNNLEIDFTPPFARRTYDDLFAEFAGANPHDPADILRRAKELHLQHAGKHPDVIKSEVFEHQVEHQLKGPIFVIDYPSSICPLTKRKTGKPEIAERFELYIHGMELANAYTELNDPDLQEELFRTQLAGQAEDDSMAKMDHDFVRSLRHGMPPAGGLGIGIDRLVMLLTNSSSIRDVVLFPLLREEQQPS